MSVVKFEIESWKINLSNYKCSIFNFRFSNFQFLVIKFQSSIYISIFQFFVLNSRLRKINKYRKDWSFLKWNLEFWPGVLVRDQYTGPERRNKSVYLCAVRLNITKFNNIYLLTNECRWGALMRRAPRGTGCASRQASRRRAHSSWLSSQTLCFGSCTARVRSCTCTSCWLLRFLSLQQ